MADFTAADVKRLRDATGAGMMDAKKALVETDGDAEKASLWLREKGLASKGKREGREAAEGTVALAAEPAVVALVELKCETDFVAKNPDFVNLANDLAAAAVESGDEGVASRQDEVDTLNITLKENIGVGRVVRYEASEGTAVDGYLHAPEGRGKNGVVVEVAGGAKELARAVAMHISFARPRYVLRQDVPSEMVDTERRTFENMARNEGKPEQALPKIVEGRLNGFFKEVCLLEQPYIRDEKQTIHQLLGDATVARFDQVEIGAK